MVRYLDQVGVRRGRSLVSSNADTTRLAPRPRASHRLQPHRKALVEGKKTRAQARVTCTQRRDGHFEALGLEQSRGSCTRSMPPRDSVGARRRSFSRYPLSGSARPSPAVGSQAEVGSPVAGASRTA